jgi:stage III sporulation protein SpoIIIAA
MAASSFGGAAFTFFAKKGQNDEAVSMIFPTFASRNFRHGNSVIEKLISNLQNGRNTVLISQRRIGKTGLIKNVFHHLSHTEKDAVCIYVDIMATKNQHEIHAVKVSIIFHTTVFYNAVLTTCEG